MKIKELISLLQKSDQETDVCLLDLSTDDPNESVYPLTQNMLCIEHIVAHEYSTEVIGKALFICFDNKLNENPI